MIISIKNQYFGLVIILGCHSASVGYSKADLDPANSLKLFVQNTIGKRATLVH